MGDHWDMAMGMRFSPTDEELIYYYLWCRLNNGVIPQGVIKELNIYEYEPYQLPSKCVIDFCFNVLLFSLLIFIHMILFLILFFFNKQKN